MKNKRYELIILFFLIALFMSGSSSESKKSLAEIYKNGTVRFVPEITLDDNSMPENVFFESPYTITFDNEGNVYICDYRANNIKKFNASGEFIKIIGREGQGLGEFS